MTPHSHSFVRNENWQLDTEETMRLSVINMYFTLTTISTIGFGDYYPISDTERLVWSMVMLSGVALFSYFMGILLEMIAILRRLDE
jgi:voltage-gated potassium channel